MRHSYPKLHSIKWKGQFDSMPSDLNAQTVLETAKKEELTGVIIIGTTRKDGIFMASSYSDDTKSLYLCEKFKSVLLNMHD